MDMATDADINIEHRLTEVEQRAKSNTNRLNPIKRLLILITLVSHSLEVTL